MGLADGILPTRDGFAAGNRGPWTRRRTHSSGWCRTRGSQKGWPRGMYYTARDLAMMVDYRDFLFALDFQDTCHLTALPGCHAGQREERSRALAGGGARRELGLRLEVSTSYWMRRRLLVLLRQVDGSCPARGSAHHNGGSAFGQTTAGALLSYRVDTVRRHFARETGAAGQHHADGWAGKSGRAWYGSTTPSGT